MAAAAREPLPGWLLDEVASAGRENLDADHVARYDGKEDASALEEVALLQRLGLTTSSIAIDVGAGTGQFTLAVAPVSGHVVAVDVSPVMRERAALVLQDLSGTARAASVKGSAVPAGGAGERARRSGRTAPAASGRGTTCVDAAQVALRSPQP